jgi:hypothetical protein
MTHSLVVELRFCIVAERTDGFTREAEHRNLECQRDAGFLRLFFLTGRLITEPRLLQVEWAVGPKSGVHAMY